MHGHRSPRSRSKKNRGCGTRNRQGDRNMNRFCFVVALACLASCAASAQTVYRCGSEYTRVPCADGVLIDVSDPVTAEQRAEARDAARREQRLGEAMARE